MGTRRNQEADRDIVDEGKCAADVTAVARAEAGAPRKA